MRRDAGGRCRAGFGDGISTGSGGAREVTGHLHGRERHLPQGVAALLSRLPLHHRSE